MPYKNFRDASSTEKNSATSMYMLKELTLKAINLLSL
jgi:hypothetical protein